MNLTILDGHTLNPGDLTWDNLHAIANVTLYPRTSPDLLIQHLAGADACLTNKVPIPAEVFGACPQLKYIGVTATGYNIIEMTAAKEAGVVVTNVPGYSTKSVAQVVFALLLEITHHVGHHSNAVRQGAWSRCADFSFWDFPLIELAGLTMGIVGFGQTGRSVGKIADALGMRVLVHTRTKPECDDYPIVHAEFDTLLREADVISLHCPLTAQTKNLISRPQLEKMKSSAILINTARGPLLNEADVAHALIEKTIGHVAVDVLSAEPPAEDNPLLKAPNCLVIPHIAWASLAARQRLMKEVVENVIAFQQGNPRNLVW